MKLHCSPTCLNEIFLVLILSLGANSVTVTANAEPARSANGDTADTGASLDGFWKLCRAKDYTGAANLFDSLMASAHPGATAYYYAARANQQANKLSRAKQFFTYIIAAFPNSPEATIAKKSLGLPAKDDEVSKATSTSEEAGSSKDAKADASADAAPATATASNVRRVGDHPFSPEQIALEGLNGIDQTNAPNCWFESAMSALAQLPKGQRAISQMITYGQGDSYSVRFPGDGVEYKITKAELAASGVKNTALWASLLDYAERRKFPNNVGASGPDEDKHRLQVGLGAITGCSAEMIFPRTSTKQAVASFIYGAVSSHNPVTCGSAGRDKSIPAPVIEGHAYTIIGYEPSKNMITLRNPHGRKARRFSVPDDPAHLRFEQLDDGVCKMNLDLFCDAFGSVCRSFM